MKNKYNPADVMKLFKISSETVRTWSDEFARHMSPLANPGNRRHRSYSYADMEVLSLVAAMKANNMTFADVHISLDSGQRGVVPDEPVELSTNEIETALQNEIMDLRSRINRLEGENSLLKGMLKDTQTELFEAKHRLRILTEGNK